MKTNTGCFKFYIPAASYTVWHNVAGLGAALEYSVSLCTMEKDKNQLHNNITVELISPIQFSKDQNSCFHLGK